jgi:general secretion pathway protein K
MARSDRQRDGERGSIAILALWGVALIALLLIAASFATRGEVLIARNAVSASRVRLAAEAGTQLGLARLLRRNRNGANFDGAAEAWRDGSIAVRIAIADEAGKIDINEAPLELLTGLFVAVGRSREEASLLACNILDRRGDAVPACPQPIAGDQGKPRSYRFLAPEELAQLPGFDDALYDRIADCVTVATGASAIDPLVAPRTVLLALPGATDTLIESYLGDRAMWRDMAGADQVLQQIPAAPFLMASPRRDFTIEAVAAAPDGARFRADLQVRLTELANRPYQVMAWRAPPVDRGAPEPQARRVP